MSRALRVAALTVVWVALWGTPSWANAFWGLVIGLGVTFAFPTSPTSRLGLRPLAALRFLVEFAWMLVVSTTEVVVEVLRPRLDLRGAIVAVPLRTDDPVITTIVANGITLTPGTLTVDVGDDLEPPVPHVLYVHALRLGSEADVVAGAHRLEDLAVAAFPPRDAARGAPTAGRTTRSGAWRSAGHDARPRPDQRPDRRPGSRPTGRTSMTFAANLAFLLLSVGAIATTARLVLGPTLADRVVATDLLLTLLVGAAAVEVARTGDGTYLTVMLIVAVVGFLGTAAVARYVERRGA